MSDDVSPREKKTPPAEVHWQQARHPGENPLLLVMPSQYPEEWYFEVVGDKATARCRIQFEAPDIDNTVQELGPGSIIPADIEAAVLEYGGRFSVDHVPNPVARRGEL